MRRLYVSHNVLLLICLGLHPGQIIFAQNIAADVIKQVHENEQDPVQQDVVNSDVKQDVYPANQLLQKPINQVVHQAPNGLDSGVQQDQNSVNEAIQVQEEQRWQQDPGLPKIPGQVMLGMQPEALQVAHNINNQEQQQQVLPQEDKLPLENNVKSNLLEYDKNSNNVDPDAGNLVEQNKDMPDSHVKDNVDVPNHGEEEVRGDSARIVKIGAADDNVLKEKIDSAPPVERLPVRKRNGFKISAEIKDKFPEDKIEPVLPSKSSDLLFQKDKTVNQLEVGGENVFKQDHEAKGTGVINESPSKKLDSDPLMMKVLQDKLIQDKLKRDPLDPDVKRVKELVQAHILKSTTKPKKQDRVNVFKRKDGELQDANPVGYDNNYVPKDNHNQPNDQLKFMPHENQPPALHANDPANNALVFSEENDHNRGNKLNYYDNIKKHGLGIENNDKTNNNFGHADNQLTNNDYAHNYDNLHESAPKQKTIWRASDSIEPLKTKFLIDDQENEGNDGVAPNADGDGGDLSRRRNDYAQPDNNELRNDIPEVLDEYDEVHDREYLDKGLQVLPTIDNHKVVQSSQQGIKRDQNANQKNETEAVNLPIGAPVVFNEDNDQWSNHHDDADNNNNKQMQGSFQYKPRSTTPKPIPKARPDSSARKDVIWLSEYHSYSLRASVDNRFRIRYAPIPADGTPWPKPQEYTAEKLQFTINPYTFLLNAAGESCDILEFAIDRARRNMFGDLGEEDGERYSKKFDPANDSVIRLANVTVLRECDLFPHLDMDESYDLEVRQSGVVIIAREVWGAVRGLETLSQLVYQDTRGIFVVNKTLIHDFPRFKHRGILLDTSRHYLSKETILLNLEAMAQNKMNVFHWHIVDEQSFPFVSHSYPNLTKQGAYDPVTHVYTHDVILQIIDEARVRGIRVIPEFDTPGHTFAWGLGQDNLLTPCYDYNGKADGFFGPINPILKSTYTFLDGLFREVFGLFKDKYVHLGGDEVSLDCWNTNPYLQRFMRRNNLYDVRDLLNVYTKKLVDIVADIGKSRDQGSGYIVWQEVFDDGVKLKPDAIVQIWKGNAWDLDRVTSKGLRALFSTCWYLDYISYGQDWDKYYMCNQVLGDLDMYNVRNQSLIMGGDVCMWAEYADDENILPRIWPRASAAAERLWSSKDVANMQEAAPRLEEHRCRMKRRGIPTGVLSGPGYCRKYSRPSVQKASNRSTLDNFYNWLAMGEPAKGAAPLNAKPHGYSKTVYNVDMNSMYWVPLVVIVCIVCLTILATVHDSSKYRLLAIFTLPVKSSSKRGFRSLLYVFMVFALVWCVWTAPIWMHFWENNASTHRM